MASKNTTKESFGRLFLRQFTPESKLCLLFPVVPCVHVDPIESSVQCSCFVLRFFHQRDLVLISEEVSRRRDEGRALSRRQPQARSSVTLRLEELESFWTSIQEKASLCRERLGQAEDVQKYLSHWTELV